MLFTAEQHQLGIACKKRSAARSRNRASSISGHPQKNGMGTAGFFRFTALRCRKLRDVHVTTNLLLLCDYLDCRRIYRNYLNLLVALKCLSQRSKVLIGPDPDLVTSITPNECLLNL